MGDEDPCECLWNQELAMRRLLTLLRQGQSYCTDIECLDTAPSMPREECASGASMFMLFLLLVFSITVFIMRPRINLSDAIDTSKPYHSEDEDDYDYDARPSTQRF